MATENNFYAKLGLSVERFEADPQVLSKLAEEKITAWNSMSAASKEYTFAQINGDNIRAAIKDSALWKRIYEEYKADVDQDIAIRLMRRSEDGVTVTTNVASSIAEEYHVSASYVQGIAKIQGLRIQNGASSNASGAFDRVTLESLKPSDSVINRLKKSSEQLAVLSFANLIDFINANVQKQDLFVSLNSPQQLIVDRLNGIKKKYSPMSSTGKMGIIKQSVETICSGMLTFFKHHSMKDYDQYLHWKQMSDILRELERDDVKTLNQRSFDMIHAQLFEIYGDREAAKQILESFCDDKHIGYMRSAPNLAICPYCNGRFERANPIQNKCPICGRDFMVICPKCGRKKHMIGDGQCDGIDLTRYPFLIKQAQKASGYADSLAITQALNLLEEIDREWPELPEAKTVKRYLHEIDQRCGDKLRRIEELSHDKKYREAKKLSDEIKREFPNASANYAEIDTAIATADELWKAYEAEKDARSKRGLLLSIVDVIADDPRANAAIQSQEGSIFPVTMLKVDINPENGMVTLKWQSKNEPNSVTYRIRRKRGSVISNITDGEEIGNTNAMFFSDGNVLEGEPLFYAVYASIGPINSQICAQDEPMLILKKPDVNIGMNQNMITGSWPLTPQTVKMIVRYGFSPIQRMDEGSACENVTASGFSIQNVQYGIKYYFAIAKEVVWDQRHYLSEILTEAIVPMEAIPYPELEKRLSGTGEYTLTHLNPHEGIDLLLFYQENDANVSSNTDMPVSRLQEKLMPLSAISLGNNQYKVSLSNKRSIIVYPVYIRDGMASVGRYQNLKYIDALSIRRSIVNADGLTLFLDQWPSNVLMIMPCYSHDRYPETPMESDKRLNVVGKRDRSESILIPDIGNQAYYITLFAKVDGGWIPICNYFYDNVQPIKIKYEMIKGGLLSSGSIVLLNESDYRPELHFYVQAGSKPLEPVDGRKLMSIPAREHPPAKEVIKLVKPPAKNMYGALFTEEKGYELVQSGSGKL